MNLSFRRSSVASPDKKEEDDDVMSKKSSFNFGDMGKNLNFKKIFSDKDKVDLKRSKSGIDGIDSANTRMKEIMSLLEEFRLQCPPTHAGLVVAFTATTLSPLSDPDIKYKWYRMDKAQDQFLQIDQGSRAWYPPTADDIGKKICAQCEDVFEQGYCRYAETGPVEADPLLRSMLDSALENGSYAIKDVSISLGINILDPEANAMVISFDMQAKQRLSALEQSPSPIGSGGFAQFEGRYEVEVDTGSIFLSFADDLSSPGGSTSINSKKGLNIKSSPNILVECALPATLIITVPLPLQDPVAPSVALAGMAVQENLVEEKTDSASGVAREEQSSANIAMDDPTSLVAVEPAENSLSSENLQWEWIGEKCGNQYEQVVTFFKNIGDCIVPEFRICLACCDRMQRDAMALSIRSLTALGPDAGMRERMSVLPWIGVANSKGSVQSMAGSELGARLKDLENENKALKRERDELNLQIMEHGVESGGKMISRSMSADISGEGNDDTGGGYDETANSRAKIKQLESEILASRRKEMEVEQSSLEKEAEINRLTSEVEAKEKHAAELERKLSSRETSLCATEAVVADLKSKIISMEDSVKNISKEKAEVEQSRTTLREMENELVSLKKSLAEAESRYDGQLSETRVIAAELLTAQTQATEMAKQAHEATANYEDVRSKLEIALANKTELELQYATLLEQQKSLEEAAQSAVLYEEALDSIDKLEGERNHWQHKSESLAKDVKRLLKQMEDLHNTTSYQLKESSRALEIRNEEYKNLEASMNSKNTSDGNEVARRMSIFGRMGKKGEEANSK